MCMDNLRKYKTQKIRRRLDYRCLNEGSFKFILYADYSQNGNEVLYFLRT